MGNGAGHTDSAAWRLRLSGCAVLLLLCVNLASVMCHTKTMLRQTSVAEPAKGDEFRRLEALGPMRLRRLMVDDGGEVIRLMMLMMFLTFSFELALKSKARDEPQIGLDKTLISDFYERPTDWAIYIVPHYSVPIAFYRYRGQKIPVQRVGECIKGSACYGFPDTHSFTNLQKPFIFSFSSKMQDPTINGQPVPEGRKGVFVFDKGDWRPLEEFDAWSEPAEKQPIKSHLVTFDGASPKKGFILEYEMAPSAALLKKGLLETTDNRIRKLQMTSSYLPDLTWSYVCQPAIPPGYTLTRLRVLDGDQMLFNSEVEQENLPFVLRIRHESSKIRYGVDGRQEPIPQTSTTDQKPVDENAND